MACKSAPGPISAAAAAAAAEGIRGSHSHVRRLPRRMAHSKAVLLPCFLAPGLPFVRDAAQDAALFRRTFPSCSHLDVGTQARVPPASLPRCTGITPPQLAFAGDTLLVVAAAAAAADGRHTPIESLRRLVATSVSPALGAASARSGVFFTCPVASGAQPFDLATNVCRLRACCAKERDAFCPCVGETCEAMLCPCECPKCALARSPSAVSAAFLRRVLEGRIGAALAELPDGEAPTVAQLTGLFARAAATPSRRTEEEEDEEEKDDSSALDAPPVELLLPRPQAVGTAWRTAPLVTAGVSRAAGMLAAALGDPMVHLTELAAMVRYAMLTSGGVLVDAAAVARAARAAVAARAAAVAAAAAAEVAERTVACAGGASTGCGTGAGLLLQTPSRG
jgi:hypothetical protein